MGDYVEAAGTSGSVEEIQIFACILKTPDNKRTVVPNAAVTGGNIVNYSVEPTPRIDLVFGIGYEDNIKKAKDILNGLLKNCDKVLTEPEPVVAVLELADSSVNLAVRPWVRTEDYWSVYFELMEGVKVAL